MDNLLTEKEIKDLWAAWGVGSGGVTWFVHKKEKKCECGSEKARVPGHSTWCPKYEK